MAPLEVSWVTEPGDVGLHDGVAFVLVLPLKRGQKHIEGRNIDPEGLGLGKIVSWAKISPTTSWWGR